MWRGVALFGQALPVAAEQNHLPRWEAADGCVMRCCVEGAGKCLHLPRWARLQASLAGVCVEGEFANGEASGRHPLGGGVEVAR